MDSLGKRKKQKNVVYYHCMRAKKLGRPATLTVEQWLKTLDDFHWKCAYCLDAPYEALDHFIPLKPGCSPLITKRGGTTADNCVPACRTCNAQKSGTSPEYIMKRYKRKERRYPKYCTSILRSYPRYFPTPRMIKRICRYLKISLFNP